jgi:hypothetical protein
MNIYYHKRCNLDILAFWRSILRLSAGLVVPVIFGVLLNYWLRDGSLWAHLGGIAGYTAIYGASMWLVGMNRDEKEMIRRMLRLVRGKGANR